ncbi:MAG: exopolysaccharide biosynthesis polyprenyl glycosylphosphotransferase [Armatimonadia bacterium]|nr:exopolysaccharide biosynthesis polyprenyl glycosylphosphotransferase [Armatimonadia bacterium]
MAHDQAVKPKETEEPTASVPAEPSRSGNGVVTAADPERNPRQRARGRAATILLIADMVALCAGIFAVKMTYDHLIVSEEQDIQLPSRWGALPTRPEGDYLGRLAIGGQQGIFRPAYAEPLWGSDGLVHSLGRVERHLGFMIGIELPLGDLLLWAQQDALQADNAVYLLGVYGLLFLLAVARFGSYDFAVISSKWQQAARIIAAHFWAVFWLWLIVCALTQILIDPVPLLMLATVGTLLNVSARWAVQSFGMRAVFTERALVLGGDDESSRIRQMEETFADIDRVEVVGRVTPEELQAHGDTEATAKALLALARSLEVDAIVVGGGQGVDDRIYVALSLCTEEGVRVVRMPEYVEEWAMMVPVEYVNDAWRVYGFNHEVDPYYTVVHRLMDIVCATLGLLLFVVLFVPIALLIKLTSKGPIIYTSSDPAMMRVGLGGRKFRIFKFRTMTLEAAKAVSRQKEDEDPRVTKVGRFLRKTKLDELPQMWNVLRGQMSIVGPRPICASEDEEMLERIPLYHLRRLVRPGLTGLGQVSFGTAKLAKEHLERLQYDLYYIKHRCFALDMAILARTTLVCLGLRSR